MLFVYVFMYFYQKDKYVKKRKIVTKFDKNKAKYAKLAKNTQTNDKNIKFIKSKLQ